MAQLPDGLTDGEITFRDGKAYQRVEVDTKWATQQVAISTLRKLAGEIERGAIEVTEMSVARPGVKVPNGEMMEYRPTGTACYSVTTRPVTDEGPS